MKLSDFKIPAACIAAGIAIGIAIGAFFQGHFNTSTETETTTKVVSGTKAVKKETRTVTVKAPDGTQTTDTTVKEETDVSRETRNESVAAETKAAPSKIHIQALVGLDTTRNFIPVYGVAVSKDLLGPVSIGAWGLTTGVVGASVGISF